MIRLAHSAASLGGAIAAQASLLACVAWLGRAQGVAALGVFGYQLALGTFGGTLLALRYELACVSDDPRAAFDALRHAFVLACGVAALIALGVAASGRADLYPVVLFGCATWAQLAVGGYLNSLRRYGWIAASRAAANLLMLAWLAWLAGGAPAGVDAFAVYAIAHATVAALMLGYALRAGRRDETGPVARAFFVAQCRYPLYILPSTLCAAMQTYALSIAIPLWFDARSAGLFALAYWLGGAPVSLLGQGVGAVFRRDALAVLARGDENGGVADLYRRYALGLAALAFAYGGAGLLLVRPVVELGFGLAWADAAAFYRGLAPCFIVQMVYVPLAQVFLVVGAQRADLLFQCGAGLALAAALAAAWLMNLSALDGVRLFALAGAAVAGAGLVLTYGLARRATPRHSIVGEPA
ncbi:translocase [Burkholderia guangdongensis]|uniref:translocase n=1 Tax=Burkholderia guangdongensis TaxID=1792500 RepID=UPI0015CEE6F5|nr:translocase [Burkholderia guangdongensis]